MVTNSEFLFVYKVFIPRLFFKIIFPKYTIPGWPLFSLENILLSFDFCWYWEHCCCNCQSFIRDLRCFSLSLVFCSSIVIYPDMDFFLFIVLVFNLFSLIYCYCLNPSPSKLLTRPLMSFSLLSWCLIYTWNLLGFFLPRGFCSAFSFAYNKRGEESPHLLCL